jgi:branched-chain amino acid transport system permease protein
VFIVLQVLASDLIGLEERQVGHPWGLRRLEVGGVVVFHADLAKLVITAAVVALLGLFLKRSRLGLAMRASAASQETALALGVPAGRMFGLAWAISGALAAVAGMLVSTGGAGFTPSTTFIALKALPAIVLGGLDSVRGAVVGGLVIGLAEAYTKAYQPDLFPWAGANFDQVVPYLVMLLVLLVRPYGLFGTREVERV